MNADAIGVVGGLGPLATVYFLERVVALTDVDTDQEHVNLVVMQHASTPDRTAFVTGRSDESPLPTMLANALTLERLGVSAIVMPCNTAHYFHAELSRAVSIPFPSIVDVSVDRARTRRPSLTRLGLLATDGTVASGMYAEACQEAGIACVVPDADVQAEVMDVIYCGVKAGAHVDRERYDALLDHLRGKGAEAIVLGCTELSVLGHDFGLDPDVVDSLDALAFKTIELSGKPVTDGV